MTLSARPSIAGTARAKVSIDRPIQHSPNFDSVARAYRWMEYLSFGPLLERCRFAQLDLLGDPRRALVIGDGDGRFLARLLARYPQITVDAIDLSGEMVCLARSRVEIAGAGGRVNFRIGDVRTWTPKAGAGYDLVATHFLLDCLTESEIEGLIERVQPSCTEDVTWVVSEFAIPDRNPVRWIGRLLVSSLYFAFRLLTGLRVSRLPDYAAAFARAGMVRGETRLFLRGILRSERWRAGQRIEIERPPNRYADFDRYGRGAGA